MSSERDRLAGRRANLELRARLNREIRAFFEEEGFVEIEAPLAVPSPGLELHLQAFGIEPAAAREASSDRRYLITSPEYQMKRLLAGGLERIYSLGKVFRSGEAGAQHNPEFTMLEWYRADAGWREVAADTERLIERCAQLLVGTTRVGGLDVAAPWERLTVADATERWAGVRVEGDETLEALRERLEAAGHRVPREGDWSDVFFTMFLDAVDPHLGRGRPVLLHDWPRPLAALARVSPDNPRVVERFEAYAGGLELCNGFGELTDPVEQRSRLEADLAERRRRGLAEYPVDERFLAALRDMPPSGGNALGVDRLAMLLFGASDIRQVLAFADDEL